MTALKCGGFFVANTVVLVGSSNLFVDIGDPLFSPCSYGGAWAANFDGSWTHVHDSLGGYGST